MELTGLYYSENIEFRETSNFDPSILESGAIYYEVLRIVDGTALFLEDHLDRLQQSVTLAGRQYLISVPLIHYLLRNLILRNNTSNGNVKMILHFRDNTSPVIYTFFIPHFYPGPELYVNGVVAALYKAERRDPNIKQVHSAMTAEIGAFIRKKKIYDALLVDLNDQITEGSKTNVFFVNDDTVYTAPADRVLIGVTRTKIIDLCKALNINIIEDAIATSDLNNFKSAFFTGTSPRVLPIKKIDQFVLDVNNPVVRRLMHEYDVMVHEYLNNN